MGEHAFFRTKTTLLIVLMPKPPPAPVAPTILRRLRLRCRDWSPS